MPSCVYVWDDATEMSSVTGSSSRSTSSGCAGSSGVRWVSKRRVRGSGRGHETSVGGSVGMSGIVVEMAGEAPTGVGQIRRFPC